jgi:DmsE family decaheme c-type cytochrome
LWLFPLVLALFCIPPSMAEEGYVGSETCAICHEEIALEFGKTEHAIAHGWDAEAGCESCHGPGAAHADGDETAIVKPQDLPPLDQAGNCLGCHERQETQFGARYSVHTLSDVSCISCHNPHSSAEKLLDTRGPDLCAKCHMSTVASFDQPLAHPLPDDDVACASCHDPHTVNTLPTQRGRGNTTCNKCHIENEGPFVYSHDVAFVDTCATCHMVHGSTNRHLLRHDRQINLCYQCHPATMTPTFHNAADFAIEQCTACHTAIHGSNTNPFFLEE